MRFLSNQLDHKIQFLIKSNPNSIIDTIIPIKRNAHNYVDECKFEGKQLHNIIRFIIIHPTWHGIYAVITVTFRGLLRLLVRWSNIFRATKCTGGNAFPPIHRLLWCTARVKLSEETIALYNWRCNLHLPKLSMKINFSCISLDFLRKQKLFPHVRLKSLYNRIIDRHTTAALLSATYAHTISFMLENLI